MRWLSELATKIDRLVSRLPPEDSPYRDNLLCHLRQPNIPCRCVFWYELTSKGNAKTGEGPTVIRGCYREVLPAMLNGIIVNANITAEQATETRADVQALITQVSEARRALAMAQATPLIQIQASTEEPLCLGD